MSKPTKTVHKKSRGRPSGTKYSETIPARFEPATIAALGAWAAANRISRSEAIRRLVELGLKAETRSNRVAKPGRRTRAQELAREVIEKMIDPAATPDERDQRRRRLTKGPPEFRDHRVDLPKAKGK
jgi:hypothetical protein